MQEINWLSQGSFTRIKSGENFLAEYVLWRYQNSELRSSRDSLMNVKGSPFTDESYGTRK